jgi:hypothetical protein
VCPLSVWWPAKVRTLPRTRDPRGAARPVPGVKGHDFKSFVFSSGHHDPMRTVQERDRDGGRSNE